MILIRRFEQVEVEHNITPWRAQEMASSGGKFLSLKTCKDGIIQVDVKHIGAQEVEVSTSGAGQVRVPLGDDVV